MKKRDELVAIASGFESNLETVFSDKRFKKSKKILNRVMSEIIIDALEKTDLDESTIRAYIQQDTKLETDDIEMMSDVLRVFRGSKSSEAVDAIKGYKYILTERMDCKTIENL